MVISTFLSVFFYGLEAEKQNVGLSTGADTGFFLGGCTRLLLYFNTNKPHSIIFCRIPVVLENLRSSGGGGGADPLHASP